MSKRVVALSIALLTIIYACNRNPYSATNKIYKKQVKLYAKQIRKTPDTIFTNSGFPPYWIGTTNFNIRKPNFVVLHYTAQNSCDQTLKVFTRTASQVSAHYVVCKDGRVHHMLSDDLRAWHAGVSRWGNSTDVNSASVGIEIDNNGAEPYTPEQVASLFTLLSTLKAKYAIPTANFIGHSDVAPSRKIDPGIFFPWKSLADSGYGIWFGDTTNLALPDSFNYFRAMRVIGYDIKDTLSAIRAFKLHFMRDTSLIIGEPDKKILFDLERKML